MSLLVLSLMTALLMENDPTCPLHSLQPMTPLISAYHSHNHLTPSLLTYDTTPLFAQENRSDTALTSWKACDIGTFVHYYFIEQSMNFVCAEATERHQGSLHMSVDKDEQLVHVTPPVGGKYSTVLCQSTVGHERVFTLQLQPGDSDNESNLENNITTHLQCDLSVRITYPLVLDMFLFSAWNVVLAAYGATTERAHSLKEPQNHDRQSLPSSSSSSSSSLVNWPLLCSSIHHAFLLSDHEETISIATFATLTANALYDEHTLEYWYHFCGLENLTTMVLLRQQTLAQLQSATSYCTVMDVKNRHDVEPQVLKRQERREEQGREGARDKERKRKRGPPQQLLCLEDVLISLQGDGGEGRERGGVTYISGAGFYPDDMPPPGHTSAGAASASASAANALVSPVEHGWKALFAVLKSAQAVPLPPARLHIKSLWRSLVTTLSIPNSQSISPANGATRITLIVQGLQGAAYLPEWENAYLDLLVSSCELMGIPTFDALECASGTQGMAAVVPATMIYHRYVFMHELMENLVSAKGLLRCPLSAPVDGVSHFCSQPLPRQQLSIYLTFFAAATNKHSSRLLTEKVTMLSDALLTPRPTSQTNHFPVTAPPFPSPSSSLSAPLLPYTYHTVTILLFIPQKEVRYAQEVIHTLWTRSCSKCSIVMNVVILTTDTPFVSMSPKCNGWQPDERPEMGWFTDRERISPEYCAYLEEGNDEDLTIVEPERILEQHKQKHDRSNKYHNVNDAHAHTSASTHKLNMKHRRDWYPPPKRYSEAMQVRYMYLSLRKYLQHTKTAADVVVVLRGVEAMVAMIPPAGSGE